MPLGNEQKSEEILRASYEILGVSPGATKEEIKAMYRDLAKVWHPDRFPNDERLQRKGQERLLEINQAYEVIANSGFRSPEPAHQSTRPPQTADVGKEAAPHSAPQYHAPAAKIRISPVRRARAARQSRNPRIGIVILCAVALGAALAYRLMSNVESRRTDPSSVLLAPESPQGSASDGGVGPAPKPHNNKNLLPPGHNKSIATDQVWIGFSSTTRIDARTAAETEPHTLGAISALANPEVIDHGLYVLKTIQKLDEVLAQPSDMQSVQNQIGIAHRVVETFATSAAGQSLPLFSEAARSALASYSAAHTATSDQVPKWLAAARDSAKDASDDLEYYKTTGEEIQPDVSRPARAWKKVRKGATRVWHGSD